MHAATKGQSWMFWGKSRSSGDLIEFHPLPDHCTDVAAVLRALLSIPRIHASLQSTTPSSLGAVAADRLAVVAFLHDLGKCNWGFQAKCDPFAPRTAGHVIEAVALLCDDGIRKRWPGEFRALLEAASTWFADGEVDLFSMLLAAISHHGRPVSLNDWRAAPGLGNWWRPHGGVDPMSGVADLAATVRTRFPSAFAGADSLVKATAAFQQRFAGLVMLADWIGSDTNFFPYRINDAEDRVGFATAAAQHALSAIGLSRDSTTLALAFEQTFGFLPSPAQRLLRDELPVDESSRLLILESETGSGKTEAALAWFLRLHDAHRVDGLYFALPTRVAARELYGRVWRAICATFPDASTRPGPVLLAVPGYTQIDGRSPVLTDPDGVLWEDSADARRRERTWAAERPKRFLAAPVAVGTIDQALLSTLRVKHSLLRSVCLDRHLLVVDEVHASDTYMREVLKELLRGHLARGGHALLLSATLGDAATAQFFRRPVLPLKSASEQAYPRISSPTRASALPNDGRRKTVKVELLGDLSDAPIVPRIRLALSTGARVLVVCNTVSRANALLRAVESDQEIDPSIFFAVRGVRCPHHGRFARGDREVMDAAVSAAFGRSAASGPLLLVGTQTLEQSLDIDADWLVTDLCPMDVLLQRIGRLHRHPRRDRPDAFSTPRVLLRAPPEFDVERYVGKHGELRGPAGIGRVYADGRILQRTLDILQAEPSVTIPRDNRRLVEQATHPEALDACQSDNWKRHAGHLYGIELAAVQSAIAGTMVEDPFGELHWPAPDQAVLTRLGAGSFHVQLAQPMQVFPGSALSEIGIPGHMLPAESNWPEIVEHRPRGDGGFEFAVGSKRYRYTRFGLEMDDA